MAPRQLKIHSFHHNLVFRVLPVPRLVVVLVLPHLVDLLVVLFTPELLVVVLLV